MVCTGKRHGTGEGICSKEGESCSTMVTFSYLDAYHQYMHNDHDYHIVADALLFCVRLSLSRHANTGPELSRVSLMLLCMLYTGDGKLATVV